MFTNLQTKNTRFLKLANKNKAAHSSRALESFLCLVCSAVADDFQSSQGESGHCTTLVPQVAFREKSLI